MKCKKLKLRQSVKDKILSITIISALIIVIIAGAYGMKFRAKQINNQIKMTEHVASYQSNN